MITIRDNRIWFYSQEIDSELPTLDFELISAYICPSCKSILSAYFVGTINKKILEYYWKNTSRNYQVGTIKGGSYILQTNHGEEHYYTGKNCIYKAAPGRGIENSLKALCGLGSLHSTDVLNSFVKAIETGETEYLGLSIVTDMCQADTPMLLYNIGKICSKYEWDYEKEEHLGEEIKNLMESHYKSTHSSARTERWASDSLVEGSNPSECVPEYTRLGGKRKKIRLARTQATLF